MIAQWHGGEILIREVVMLPRKYIRLPETAKEGDPCPAGDGGTLVTAKGLWLECSTDKDHYRNLSIAEIRAFMLRPRTEGPSPSM